MLLVDGLRLVENVANFWVWQIVEIILLKLENEPSFHRRVDFWFLLDSVTQVAHTQKG